MGLRMAIDTAKGMEYLHSLGIIHRDLKTGNLLLSDDDRVKVADFGVSRLVTEKATKAVGTPMYMAPEILGGEKYALSSDVYSYAFVLWEMVTREVPYGKLTPWEITKGVCEEGLRPEIPEECPFQELIAVCWSSDASKRPTFTKIINYLLHLSKLVQDDSYEVHVERRKRGDISKEELNAFFQDSEESSSDTSTPVTSSSRASRRARKKKKKKRSAKSQSIARLSRSSTSASVSRSDSKTKTLRKMKKRETSPSVTQHTKHLPVLEPVDASSVVTYQEIQLMEGTPMPETSTLSKTWLTRSLLF